MGPEVRSSAPLPAPRPSSPPRRPRRSCAAAKLRRWQPRAALLRAHLAALRPVLPHPLGHFLPLRGAHGRPPALLRARALDLPVAASAAEQLREFGADGGLFLPQLLE